MNDNYVHVVPAQPYGWEIQQNRIRIMLLLTKDDAVDHAITYAKLKKTELVVHNADGTIAYRNSYGNDPHPPKG